MYSSAKQANELLKNWSKEDDCVNCVALAALESSSEKSALAEKEGQEGDEEKTPEEEKKQSDEPEHVRLAKLEVKDTSGQLQTITTILSASKLTLVALLRHFG